MVMMIIYEYITFQEMIRTLCRDSAIGRFLNAKYKQVELFWGIPVLAYETPKLGVFLERKLS